ncbi:MAG: DUF4129 domain-containing protein [Candidatus Eremiobacteraeota bacterium]|nr:DUF4129 domain-containing protein [Candidatus Eremiobacteraeota bacterium]
MNVMPGACALLLLIATCVRPVSAQASGVSDASQPAGLDQALVREAEQLDAAAQTAATHHTHVSIAPIVLLVPPSQSASGVSVDRWVKSQLQRIDRERSSTTQERELRDLAESLRRAAVDRGQPAPPDDPQVLALSILSQRAYAHERTAPAPAPRETLLDKILKWLGGHVQDLIRAIFGAAVAVPLLGRITVITFIVAVAALAVYLIYLLVSTLARRQRKFAPNMGTPLAPLIEPHTLYERAKAAARAGQYAQAVALLFQASLRMFDGAGKLPYDASLTPGEYRRAVRRSVAAAGDPFDQIAKTFVLAAFAERTITADEYAAADQAYVTMRPLVTA